LIKAYNKKGEASADNTASPLTEIDDWCIEMASTKLPLRRVTYKLYPSDVQRALMELHCELHRHLYNAALEERINAWHKAKKCISFYEQSKSIKIIRQECEEYSSLNAQSFDPVVSI
jgi:hypothetical protein